MHYVHMAAELWLDSTAAGWQSSMAAAATPWWNAFNMKNHRPTGQGVRHFLDERS